jgi:hypothetical protein
MSDRNLASIPFPRAPSRKNDTAAYPRPVGLRYGLEEYQRKYTGISGSWKYVLHGNEFRTAAPGTFVNDFTFQGNYKLP